MFNKRRKAKSESNDDRHFGVLREGSGSVVSVVSAVISPDISDIHLTTDGISVVSGVVSVVSSPMDSGNLRENMKSPGFRIQFQNFSINCRSCGLHSTCIEAFWRF